jgi:APA family basic amino acid/polyamine antiporter
MSSTDTDTDTTRDEPELKRVMGPGLLLLFIVGDILGAGVYAVTGRVAGQVGGIAWLPFLVAFAVATLTAYSYLELVCKYPKAAGAALYTHKAFGVHFITFLVAFTVMSSGITSASTSSGLLASNLLIGLENIIPGIPTGDTATLLTALGFMLLLAAINLRGVGESVKFNVVLTLIEILALAIVIGIGFFVVAGGDSDISRITVFESPDEKGLFAAVTIATAIAFFSMVGFEDSVNMVEETKDPRRIFPKVMFTGLGIAVIVYMLVAVTVVAVIPAGDIANPQNPEAGILLDVVRIGAPDIPIDSFFPFLTVFAVANTALINMLMASRLVYGMAKQEVLPKPLGKISGGTRAPWAAIAFTTVIALVLITVVRLQAENSIVAALSGTTALLLLAVFAIVNITVLVLRREPGPEDGFKAPTWVPVVGAVACLFLLGPWARLEADYIQYSIAAGLLGLGVVLWVITVIANKMTGTDPTTFKDVEHLEG